MRKVLLLLLILSVQLKAQEAPSWIDYCQNQESGTMALSVLPDYSYAGYHFSEKPIPDVSDWNKINVTDYGALPNDSVYDDAAIRAAIKAAENSDVPTVIFLPAGKYLVSDQANQNNPFIVSKSHIVLKGAGSGTNGTEIYTNEKGSYPWRFQFKPSTIIETKIADIRKRIVRGDYTIEVLNADNLSVGQKVELYHQCLDNLEANAPGLTYNAEWNTGNRGIRTHEKHIIKSIDGKKVTFVNPVNLTITADICGAELRRYTTIEEVGVEDILFTSAWKEHPDIYAHHASDLVDYAWRALAFENVSNGWIQNCEFRDWNEDVMIEKCMGITVKNILISGKQGHTSYFARYSYGVLFENCRDIIPTGFNDAGGQGHGPGMRWATTSTVFVNCEMQKHQSIDCHGYHPYSNLLDNVYGGCIRGNGGAWNSYPNSGPYLAFWNFVHVSNYSTKEYDFWDPVNRKLQTFPYPIIVGFQSPGETIIFKNEGINELQGKKAYPNSLFDAQLQLRLYDSYMSASSSTQNHEAVMANNGDSTDFWKPASAGTDEWLLLDLGTPKPINAICLKESVERINKIKLECLIGTTWITLVPIPSQDDSSIYTFPSVRTRQIKLTIDELNNLNTESVVSITEFSAIVDENAAPPPNVFFTNGDTSLKEGYQLGLETKFENLTADIEKVDLYIDNVFIRSINAAPYVWGNLDDANNKELDGLDIGAYNFKVIATDAYGSTMTDEFQLNVLINLWDSLKACGVSATTDFGKYTPDKAVDGIYTSSSYWAGRGMGASLTIDLCNSYEVRNFGIQWYLGNRRTYNFDMEISTDSINWTNVFSGSSSGNTEELELYKIAPLHCRYLRYVGKGNSSDSWNYIIEIEIYGDKQTSTEHSMHPPLNIYPNPTSGAFKIIPSHYAPATVSIYNINGQLLFEQQNVSREILINEDQNFHSGIYILKYQNQINQKSIHKLIIK